MLCVVNKNIVFFWYNFFFNVFEIFGVSLLVYFCRNKILRLKNFFVGNVYDLLVFIRNLKLNVNIIKWCVMILKIIEWVKKR